MKVKESYCLAKKARLEESRGGKRIRLLLDGSLQIDFCSANGKKQGPVKFWFSIDLFKLVNTQAETSKMKIP